MTKEQQKAIFDTLMKYLDNPSRIEERNSYVSCASWYIFKLNSLEVAIDGIMVRIGVSRFRLGVCQSIKLCRKVRQKYREQQEKLDQRFADQALKEIQSALKIES